MGRWGGTKTNTKRVDIKVVTAGINTATVGTGDREESLPMWDLPIPQFTQPPGAVNTAMKVKKVLH